MYEVLGAGGRVAENLNEFGEQEAADEQKHHGELLIGVGEEIGSQSLFPEVLRTVSGLIILKMQSLPEARK